MKILVAGGAGFIGSHLVKHHLALRDSVVVVDNLSTGKLQNVEFHENNPAFSFYDCDLLQWEALDEVVSECDLIYDMAAVVGMFNVLEHPIDTLEYNIYMTDRILQSIAKSPKKPRTLIASSSEVYGNSHSAMKEDDPLQIESTTKAHASYPISKLCNEIYAMAYYKEKNLPVTVVRIFNTVGPYQSDRYGMVLPRFIKQALHNEPVTVFGDGSQTRSFCDVRDLVNILHRVIMSEQSLGEVINAGNDSSISILELAKLVIQLTSSQSEIVFHSLETVYGKEYIDIQQRKPNLEKLRSMIDYYPRWKIEDTIQDIIKVDISSAFQNRL